MTATAFSPDPLLDDTDEFSPDLFPGDRFPGDQFLGGRAELRLVPQPSRHSPTEPDASAHANRSLVEVYRRRRFVAALVVTVLVVLATQLLGISMLSFSSLSAPSDATPAEAIPAVHVVRPGDTYGAIAASLGADHPASFADELRDANGGAELEVGQRLVVDPTTLG